MVGIQLYIETETIKRPFSQNRFKVYSDFALQFILLSVEKERHKIVADYLQQFLIRILLFHFWPFYQPKRPTPVPFIKWLCFMTAVVHSKNTRLAPLESHSQWHHGKTDRSVYTNRTKYIRLTTTFHLTLMMTSAQVVETSVTNTDNGPSQDYTHPDDQTTLLHVTPGFKPFTVCLLT